MDTGFLQNYYREVVSNTSIFNPEDHFLTCIAQVARIPAAWERQANLNLAPTGLDNPDFRCYQNGVIQCLLHAPKFINWIETHSQDCKYANCIACALRNFSQMYWSQSRSSLTVDVTLTTLRDTIRQSKLLSKLKP